MKFDFSAAELFLAMLEGRATLEAALQHPAYQVVFAHGARFGNRMAPGDVQLALDGQQSTFYGLGHLYENLPRIRQLLDVLINSQAKWQALARGELLRLLPTEDLDAITIYPIIGYDMGIGADNCICMNLNTPQYLAEPFEFLYFIIHEAVHVLYERSHPVASLAEINTPGDWLHYFALWLQNEGFAVYAPYRLRAVRGHLADRDYQVLEDPARLESTLQTYKTIYQQLESALSAKEPRMTQERYLEAVFGSQRVTYRAGCQIFRRIEQRDGLEAVRQAFYLPPEQFLSQHAARLEN